MEPLPGPGQINTDMNRFASKALPYIEQKDVLKNLVQTYLATFADLGIETWLMHGSLLGWWWGQKVRWSGVFRS